MFFSRDKKQEQRINLKFLVKLKKTPTEYYKLLQEAYGDNSLSRACGFERCQQKTAELLKALTKEDLQHCFNQWKKRMEWCAARGGDHIEGEHSNVE